MASMRRRIHFAWLWVTLLNTLIPPSEAQLLPNFGIQWTTSFAEALEKSKRESLNKLLLRSCKQVNSSWTALINSIQQAQESLRLCPFHITKPPNATAVLEKRIHISCTKTRPTDTCVIEGEGNHIRIRGSNAEVLVERIRFEGATNSAVRISPSASRNQVLQECEFVSNHASVNGWRGAAIKTEPGTSLTVSSCVFLGNEAVQGAGGAIYSRGDLRIKDSIFMGNMARGGAITSETSVAYLEVSNSTFTQNVATRDAGGAITVDGPRNWMTDSSTGGYSNLPCSGVYDSLTGSCLEFESSEPLPYELGKLTVRQEGLRLSSGLSVKVLARAGEKVTFSSTEALQLESDIPFHAEPDGAATFALEDGGWVYVSNSESRSGNGGVYALEFDNQGLIRNYAERLTGTTRNCNGGTTPWDTWVSCEEYTRGQCWQVDPTGQREANKTNLVEENGGSFEAMAYDMRDPMEPQFFVSEDHAYGALRRFRPSNATSASWDMLHGHGIIDYLEVFPGNGTFRWTPDLERGRKSAFENFQFSEGIVSNDDGILLFVTKKTKLLFRLDLDLLTFTVRSTRIGAIEGGGNFAAGPDQLVQYADMLYFTEDGGSTPGLYVYDGSRFYTLLEAFDSLFDNDETTGVAFSPDGTKLYVCIQEAGYLFQVEREDGMPFQGTTRRLLGLKYQR